jgi:isoaspartyl peptidase/L-asparaginase-like protein (Ntn-hydrolase superfamily)
MNTRRKFLQSFAALGALPLLSFMPNLKKRQKKYTEGLVVSTWNFGVKANTAAVKKMNDGGNALDMVTAGAMEMESDPTELTIGLGGLPDREGHTTLDACVMDSIGRAGSVCFLEKIKHPVAVARAIMEKSPHVVLVGEGAQQFALQNGFPKDEYQNPEAQKAYREWLEKSEYKPIINIENHDTIGILAMDKKGDLSGACTTSGLSYKMRGRVGDSPIIGAGLYVDNEIGAATASGLGETILRSCSSFLMVELMRQGYSPLNACKEAIQRLVKINSFMNIGDYQACFIAVSKEGEIGAYSVHPGFTYSVWKNGEHQVLNAGSLLS